MTILNQLLDVLPLFHRTFPNLPEDLKLWQARYMVASEGWSFRDSLLAWDPVAKARKVSRWVDQANDCDGIAVQYLAFVREVFMGTSFPSGTPVCAPAIGLISYQRDVDGHRPGGMRHMINWVIYMEGSTPAVGFVNAAGTYEDGAPIPLASRRLYLTAPERASVNRCEYLLG